MSSFLLSVHPSIINTPLAFEFWRGEAPQLISEIGQSFTKPGTNGHGLRKLGKWGIPFTCTLESHWPSYHLAIAALQVYARVPYSGPVQVVYNNIAWNLAKTAVTVEGVRLSNESHSRILQLGPNYAYAGAGILITEWKMTAISTEVTSGGVT